MEHRYEIDLSWTGNLGRGTARYGAYARDFECRAGAKPLLLGSADPHFRGDPSRWNPEELLVASLSACHQLWYLHLCADAGVVVEAYRDLAEGTMLQTADGSGEFTRVTLRPRVRVARGSDVARAHALHAKAATMCFVARSVAFVVHHEPEVVIEDDGQAVGADSGTPRSPAQRASGSAGEAVETIDRYCAAWSSAEPRVRAEQLRSVWSERATYADPTVSTVGTDELLAHIARAHDAHPGMTVAREGSVDAHHGTARFRWRAVDGRGRTLVEGLDVATFRDDGRIASVVGFFDRGAAGEDDDG